MKDGRHQGSEWIRPVTGKGFKLNVSDYPLNTPPPIFTPGRLKIYSYWQAQQKMRQ